MPYSDKEKERQYQKDIPKELKQIYQRTRREKNKNRKQEQNLKYRLKNWQKRIVNKELKKTKAYIEFTKEISI